MVRAVKTRPLRSLKKGETAILFPGPTSAEPWEVWLFGADTAGECVQVCARPRDTRLRKGTTLALPVAEVFCLPLWLQETDPKLFAGVIQLQLEARGLQPRGTNPAVFDWSVVAQEGTRTLVFVGILPAMLTPELQAEAFDGFDLSARFLPLPEDSLIFWLERDRLAVAMTRGPHLVYHQALTDGSITSRVLQDIACARTALAMQGVLAPLQSVTLWMDITPAERNALQAAWPLPLLQAERPAPRIPARPWKLTPVAVGELKRTHEIRRWRNLGIWVVLGLYLLVVAVLGSRLFLTSLKVDELRRWQVANTPAVALVHETQAAWKDLAPVVDENSYPLELLRQVNQSIPSGQLNLTLFEAGDGHLLIKGEAKNFGAASQFEEKLQHDPFFTGYTWDMGQPHLLPNNLAQLQIEGTHAN